MIDMSLAAEEIARRELDLLVDPDSVRVRVSVSWDGDLCFPDIRGEHEEFAIFRTMTFGDNMVIEKACSHEFESDGRKVTETDFNEMRRLTIKRNLVDWSLDIPVIRENGWMTPESYLSVGKVSAPLMEAFLDGFWKTSEIGEEEEKVITRQATILFGNNSKGVMDACEAVKLYCTLGSFSEKFGIGKKDLLGLPLREYLLLKMMSNHENDFSRRNSKKGKTPTTRIAGPGGRIRPSRSG